MNEIVKIINACQGIIGKRVDGGDSDSYNPENYYICVDCGQSVYMGDLGAVFHHEMEGHKPITPDA